MERVITYAKFLLPLIFLAASGAQAHSQVQPSAAAPVALELRLHVPFTFVAYGDTRFTDPNDTKASNPIVRRKLVQAIAGAHPAFIAITGDIAYNGFDANDWRVWDSETAVWRKDNIPVFPVLGNHDLHGDHRVALANYFARFPRLENSRYYSVRAANVLLLMLDSSIDEIYGPQGEWLESELKTLPTDVNFVFVILHHPPYTSSSDAKKYGGGHSMRPQEQSLAKMIEGMQTKLRAHIVVIAGHVHNYERHQHGGVTYFVSGGGGAHAYPIERAPDDPFQSKTVNYHYLLVRVDHDAMEVTMHRLDLTTGKSEWSEPDRVNIAIPK